MINTWIQIWDSRNSLPSNLDDPVTRYAIASHLDLSFGTRLCALRDLEGIWPAEAIKNDFLDPRGQLMKLIRIFRWTLSLMYDESMNPRIHILDFSISICRWFSLLGVPWSNALCAHGQWPQPIFGGFFQVKNRFLLQVLPENLSEIKGQPGSFGLICLITTFFRMIKLKLIHIIWDYIISLIILMFNTISG